jgi:hypothetical protein
VIVRTLIYGGLLASVVLLADVGLGCGGNKPRPEKKPAGTQTQSQREQTSIQGARAHGVGAATSGLDQAPRKSHDSADPA